MRCCCCSITALHLKSEGIGTIGVTIKTLKVLDQILGLSKVSFLGTAIYLEHVQNKYSQPRIWDYDL